MLLPALSKARDTARAISCRSCKKQFGIVLVNYSMDYKEWSLGDYNPYLKGAGGASSSLSYYAFLQDSGYLPNKDIVNAAPAKSILKCPSLNSRYGQNSYCLTSLNFSLSAGRAYGIGNARNNNYIWVAGVASSAVPWNFFRPSSVVLAPSQIAWAYDAEGFDSSPAFPHNKQSSILFVDTHADSVSFRTFKKVKLSTAVRDAGKTIPANPGVLVAETGGYNGECYPLRYLK